RKQRRNSQALKSVNQRVRYFVRIRVPDEDKGEAAQRIPRPTGYDHGLSIDRFAINQKYTHNEQCDCPDQDVLDKLPVGCSLFYPVLYSEGERHADNEKKGGKDGVCQSHSIYSALDMPQPIRNIGQ